MNEKQAHHVREALRKVGWRIVKAEQHRVGFATVSYKVFIKVQAKCTVTSTGRGGLAPRGGPGLEMLFLGKALSVLFLPFNYYVGPGYLQIPVAIKERPQMSAQSRVSRMLIVKLSQKPVA